MYECLSCKVNMDMKNNDKKNGILLCIGRWTSRLGNIVFDYINSVSLASINAKNSILVAIYQSSETVLKILINLFAGVIADNTEKKKRMLIITDLISGALCIVLSFFLKNKYVATIIIVMNCILAIVNAFNSPLYRTIVRSIISKEKIGKLNSASNAGCEAASLVGPIIGLWCIRLFGVRSGLLFNGATFIVSALLESRIIYENTHSNEVKKKNIVSDLVAGFSYLKNNKQLIKIFVFGSCVNIFCAGSEVFMPYTNQIFDNDNIYASILIAEGIAGLIGSFASAFVSRFLRNNIKKIQFISVLVGISYCIIPILERISVKWLMVCPFIMISFFITIYNIQYMTYIQETIDAKFVGRIFSLLKTSSIIFVPVGAFVFSGLCHTDSTFCFTLSGLGISILSIISIFLF